MTTRHLSLRATWYSPDTWSWAVLETVCEPGKPARAETLQLHWGTREQAARALLAGVEKLMADTERDREKMTGPTQ